MEKVKNHVLKRSTSDTNYITRTKSLEFHRNLSNHLIHPTNVQRNEIPFDEYATIWNRK